MGWKASADVKRLVCASATSYGAADASSVVIDVNAVGRRCLGALSAEVTPKTAARILWRRFVLDTKPTFVYFAFDSPHLIPRARIQFLQDERYKYPRPQPPRDWVIEKEKMSLSWNTAFSSGITKARLWHVLAECIKDHIDVYAAPGVTYVVDPPNRNIYSYPAIELPPNNYGEADLKGAAIAAARDDPTTFFTIDWDAVVQMSILKASHVKVSLGNVYKKGETITYTKRKAPSGSQAVAEVVQAGGLSMGCPLSYGLCLLAIGGVDYCKGLKRFGYRERILAGHLNETQPGFFTKTDQDCTFHTQRFVEWITDLERYRPRSVCIKDLNAELNSMLYCVFYMALFQANNPRGGPEWDIKDLVCTADTIEDLLDAPSLANDLTVPINLQQG